MEEDELVDIIEEQMRGCVERMLEWLPSIDNEIVRCGECKYRGHAKYSDGSSWDTCDRGNDYFEVTNVDGCTFGEREE